MFVLMAEILVSALLLMDKLNAVNVWAYGWGVDADGVCADGCSVYADGVCADSWSVAANSKLISDPIASLVFANATLFVLID